MKRPLLLVALLFAAAASAAQPAYRLDGDSRLWIAGTSTVNSFTCAAGTLTGQGALREAPVRAARLEAGTQARLEAPVAGFDCGDPRMNRDFHGAMKAKAHPAIRFELDSAEVVGEAAGAEWQEVAARGRLTIAGVTRPVELRLQGRHLADGRVQVRGQKALRMTDFGIKPPTALLGLIKAHNQIVVHFDLRAEPAH